MLFNEIRADIIPEVMPLAHHIPCIKMKIHFLALSVEVMENPQLFRCIQLYTPRTQRCIVRFQIRANTIEIASCFFDALFADRNGDVFFLHNAVTGGGFLHNHTVVLHPVFIPAVCRHSHEHILLKIRPVQPTIVDRDLRNRTGLQTVQHLGVVQKHDFLIIFTGYLIVNIRKAPGTAVPISGKKDTIIPDTFDRDSVLYPSRHSVSLFILFE